MINIVEMTLAFSKNLPDTLLYILLTDPLTGKLFKAGIVERKILDYADKDYATVSDPNYIVTQTSTYSRFYALNGDYLFFNYIKKEGFNTVAGYDHYKVRINWITEQNILLGAYPNAITHQAIAPNPLIKDMVVMSTVEGCCSYDVQRDYHKSVAIVDSYFNIGVYYPRYTNKFYEFFFDFVMTTEGLSIVYTASYNNVLSPDTGAYLDPTLLNVNYKNGDTLTLSEQQIYRGDIPNPNNANDINPRLEYAIKQNTPNYIAKLTSLNKHIVQSQTETSCYLYQNGGNPTGWDRNIRYFHDDTYTDMGVYNGLAPDVIKMYPEFNLTTIALSSYQLYYAINQGFWKYHRYTEEIMSD